MTLMNRLHVKTLLGLILSFGSALAHSSLVHITLQSDVLPLVPSQTPNLPLPFNGNAVNLEVSFDVDEQIPTEFGNFNCGGSSHCAAYGYIASNLRVLTNGNAAVGWNFGTTSRSFANGFIDLRERNFFTAGNVLDIGNSWLPLVHEDFPEAALNFGQMYISLGGFNFTPLQFSAVDQNGERANGWVSASTEFVVQTVPEPSTVWLTSAALSVLALARRRRPLD